MPSCPPAFAGYSRTARPASWIDEDAPKRLEANLLADLDRLLRLTGPSSPRPPLDRLLFGLGSAPLPRRFLRVTFSIQNLASHVSCFPIICCMSSGRRARHGPFPAVTLGQSAHHIPIAGGPLVFRIPVPPVSSRDWIDGRRPWWRVRRRADVAGALARVVGCGRFHRPRPFRPATASSNSR